MNLTLADIAASGILTGERLERLGRRSFTGVSTDSRTVRAGNLFIALRGERFDGHRYVARALRDGAAMAIIDRKADRTIAGANPVAIVHDTTKTLGALANIYRKKFDLPVIAVAGSNGKTTTKDMILAVLGSRFRVLGTEGNLNNHIGVPQTLFRIRPGHEVLVLEVGTNHPGELRYLCSIAEPTHGLITNIGHEHLEFFKDIAGVVRAEGELFAWLGKAGLGFVNVDDRNVRKLAGRLSTTVKYGFLSPEAAVRGSIDGLDGKACGAFRVRAHGVRSLKILLTVPGRHMMENALAAAAVGLGFGVSPSQIRLALKRFRSAGKRMEVLRIGGVTVLNDTYNANSDSMRAALETLVMMSGRGKKVAVLGDMLELGVRSPREHEQIGRWMRKLAVDCLLTYGPMAAVIARHANVPTSIHAESKKILCEQVRKLVSRGDFLLVKGSRGMKMEEVVHYLQEQSTARAA